MTKVIRFFVDFDKEERWLDRMAAEGRLMTKRGLVYTSTPIEPGSAVVRIDYRPRMSAADFDDYRQLFADAGWRHLSGTRTSGTQHFASTTADADADIFSDARSRAQRYKRALEVNAVALLPLLVVVSALVSTRDSGFHAILRPEEWYLTPGLWEMQGSRFVGAFLFETVFVVMRVGLPLLLVVACAVMLATAIRQGILYRRAVSGATTA
jgi:ABC-type sugar transport system permease subunit